MPILSNPLLAPLYAGHRPGPDRENRRSCGCLLDPVVFSHWYPGGCQAAAARTGGPA